LVVEMKRRHKTWAGFIVVAWAGLLLCAASLARDVEVLRVPASDEGLPGDGPIRRAGWFTELWLNKRTAWAGRVEEDRGALAFFGDSITQGWGDDMGGAFGDTKVANRGISGDTTRGMLVRLEQDVLALAPRGVVLLMGTNDIEEEAAPEVIAGNVQLILERLKEHSEDMPIVLCLIFPSSETKKRPAAVIRAVNALYEGLAEGDERVRLVDSWSVFADEGGDAKAEEFPDLLHPNEHGYAKWAEVLRPVLEELGLVGG